MAKAAQCSISGPLGRWKLVHATCASAVTVPQVDFDVFYPAGENGDGYEDAVIDVLDASGAVALRIPCHRTIVCRASAVLRDQDRQTDSVVEGRKRLVMDDARLARDDLDDARRMVGEIYRQCGPGRGQFLFVGHTMVGTVFNTVVSASSLLGAYRQVYERWGNSRLLRDKYNVQLPFIEVHDLAAAYSAPKGVSLSDEALDDLEEMRVASWVAQTVPVQGFSVLSTYGFLAPSIGALMADDGMAKLMEASYANLNTDLERAACFAVRMLARVKRQSPDDYARAFQTPN